MKLSQLLEHCNVETIIGPTDVIIENISQDSCDENFHNGLYFAVSGTQVDGHDFITEVIKKGTVAVICEKLPDVSMQSDNGQITYIVVKNSKKIIGKIAHVFYGKPSEQLTVIAVTGTNGKTSVATYMSQSLQLLGEQPLLLSTAGDYFNGEPMNINRKAPSSLEVIELHKILAEYQNIGATHVCLEATSQGLDQHRLSGIDVDVAIFTNLGQDHLDYHNTIEHYASSKKKLFDSLKESAIAISNYDDVFGPEIVSNTSAQVYSYGSESTCDYNFSVDDVSLGLMSIQCNSQIMNLPIIGLFNVYNIISVYATLITLGYDALAVIDSLEKLQGVPGRMQSIENNCEILAVVDYAHSPGAVESVLLTLRDIPHTNIITVIGCGGDRDRTKRAPMAKVAQKYSNRVIYTADNPRTENLEQIFQDMKKGINSENNNYQFIENREQAIKQAVYYAQPNDIIVIAGKGHEDYQIIGTEKRHFDDREIVDKYLKK